MTIDVETRPVAGGLRDLTRRSARLELDGIDFASFADRPLDADTLRCLRYMHDVENHTMCYLRDVLVTRAHRDPEVTAFLACWCYEEHWHGDALAQVLRGAWRAGEWRARCFDATPAFPPRQPAPADLRPRFGFL
jgi:hypothetical protein